MSLREARREDVAAIVKMLADDQLGKSRENLDDMTPYLKAFNAIVADPQNSLWVWDEQGKVVGCLQLTYLPGISQKGAWRAQVEGVRVESSRRGAGIGNRMMTTVMQMARERGCYQMQLTTDKRRLDAHRFYERLGFAKSHEGMKLKL